MSKNSGLPQNLPKFEIKKVDKVKSGLMITFGDGRCALFTSMLLRTAMHLAKELKSGAAFQQTARD